MRTIEWRNFSLVHAELGGGRTGEFQALRHLQQYFPALPLTATVHDPERLVWRRAQLPWLLRPAEHLPSPFPQAAALLADPWTLREERSLARGVRRLVTLTELGGQRLKQRMHLRPEQLTVIPHGNLTLAQQPLPPLQPLRLLYFGFIYRGKGIENLLDALAQVLQAQPDLSDKVRLTLAGGTAPDMAFQGHGNYLDQLRQRVAERGLSDMVDWLPDLPAAEIAATIQSHHVMVLPYRESRKLAWLGEMRGTSGALSWANACGRGVITSDARAFGEEVISGNGTTYAQGDVAALAAAIAQLLQKPALAQQWATRAQSIGQARGWTQIAGRFAAMFRQVIEEGR
ncbi:glycosyltransferase [Comamonas sp. NoAH]|uniref:glycosyltransferase n=1 Tax=Comamonas halotolerans TaxID=3041496 RepID=UPI0024E0A191|nr:glycosyltransferase [Comamonas sp. NoAH]